MHSMIYTLFVNKAKNMIKKVSIQNKDYTELLMRKKISTYF